jgi:transcriptional regulator with XRE-family HTH domain
MTEDYLLKDDEFRSFLKTLGTRIKVIRTAKGMQFRDIMIKVGYFDSQWRKYEAGGSLNISSLMKIALTLDVTLTELLDGLGQWPKLSVAEIQAQHEGEIRTSSDADCVLQPEPKSKSKRVRSAATAAKEIVQKVSLSRSPKKIAARPGAPAGRTLSKVAAPSADSKRRRK